MHPRLIKLTIPKHTLLPRQALMTYLDGIGRLDALPERRGGADAWRVGTAYLRKYHSLAPSVHRCYNEEDCSAFGHDHLFDSDLRRLALTLLGDTVSPLWPGLYVALGPIPALDQVADLDRLLTAGSLLVQTLLLARSQDNLNLLATELGEQWRIEHHTLMARLDKAPPTKEEELDAVYQRFRRKLSHAEEALGRPILSL